MLERPVWAEINLDAYNKNISRIRNVLNPSSKICAVVKADAYGHGVVPIAHEALRAGASCLGVALTIEGIELRKAGFTETVLVLGLTPPEIAHAAVDNGLELAVADTRGIEALSKAAIALNRKVSVHLKIDTGMGRLGIRPEDAPRFARLIKDSEGLYLAGVFSHFADADNADLSCTREQLKKFLAACSSIEKGGMEIPLKHIANSAGFLNLKESHLDMVRPGIMSYGFDAVRHGGSPKDKPEYFPVMTLKAKASFVKNMNTGETVSYCRNWTAKGPCRIATVPLGYADGYSRSFTNKGIVGVRGSKVPVTGNVCMDQFMVDVSRFEDFMAGEEVIIFGKNGPSVDELVPLIDSIHNEIVTRIGKRVPRVYVRE